MVYKVLVHWPYLLTVSPYYIRLDLPAGCPQLYPLASQEASGEKRVPVFEKVNSNWKLVPCLGREEGLVHIVGREDELLPIVGCGWGGGW